MAKGGTVGDDEQDNREIAVEVGNGGLVACQQLLYRLKALVNLCLVVQQIGTEQDDGLEALAPIGFREVDVGIGIAKDGAKLTVVSLVALLRAATAMQMAEILDDAVFETDNQRYRQIVVAIRGLVLVNMAYVEDIEARNVQRPLACEHLHTERQEQLAVVLDKARHDTDITLHGACDDAYRLTILNVLIAGARLAHGGHEALLTDHTTELEQRLAANLDGMVVAVTIDADALPQRTGPVGIEYLPGGAAVGTDEDEMTQVTTEGVLIERRVVGRILTDLAQRLQHVGVHIISGYVVVERGHRVVVIGRQIDLAPEDLGNLRGFGMTKYAPLAHILFANQSDIIFHTLNDTAIACPSQLKVTGTVLLFSRRQKRLFSVGSSTIASSLASR